MNVEHISGYYTRVTSRVDYVQPVFVIKSKVFVLPRKTVNKTESKQPVLSKFNGFKLFLRTVDVPCGVNRSDVQDILIEF